MIHKTVCILNDADVNLHLVTGDNCTLSFSVGDFHGQSHESPKIRLGSIEFENLREWLKKIPESAKSDAAHKIEW